MIARLPILQDKVIYRCIMYIDLILSYQQKGNNNRPVMKQLKQLCTPRKFEQDIDEHDIAGLIEKKLF